MPGTFDLGRELPPPCPKCHSPLVPLARAIPGKPGEHLAPGAGLDAVTSPVLDDPIRAYAYRDYTLFSMFSGLLKVIADLIGTILYLLFGWLIHGPKRYRLGKILKEHPRSLYCPRCKYIQRRR